MSSKNYKKKYIDLAFVFGIFFFSGICIIGLLTGFGISSFELLILFASLWVGFTAILYFSFFKVIIFKEKYLLSMTPLKWKRFMYEEIKVCYLAIFHLRRRGGGGYYKRIDKSSKYSDTECVSFLTMVFTKKEIDPKKIEKLHSSVPNDITFNNLELKSLGKKDFITYLPFKPKWIETILPKITVKFITSELVHKKYIDEITEFINKYNLNVEVIK